MRWVINGARATALWEQENLMENNPEDLTVFFDETTKTKGEQFSYYIPFHSPQILFLQCFELSLVINFQAGMDIPGLDDVKALLN